ncbi:MAG: ATP-binding cassette domain-containing protein [Phycisphaerales bacterium]|nr:ATP-binding cassette domain-containing protein [Phycisphaerales bacterium]
MKRAAAEHDARPGLEVTALSLPFPGGKGLDKVHLRINRGESVALLGPSGAGKTTLVELVAGLITARSGTVGIAGQDVTKAPPRQRDIGAILQDVPLYDHLDVRGNVEMALSSRRLAHDERSREVDAALQAVDATSLAERSAATLSGGERARVAVARILARRPAVVLLDEPYAAVDALHRGPLRRLLRNELVKSGAAVLHVTHDVEEAADVADRIAVMASGRILQIGSVDQLRSTPADPVVAALFPSS